MQRSTEFIVAASLLVFLNGSQAYPYQLCDNFMEYTANNSEKIDSGAGLYAINPYCAQNPTHHHSNNCVNKLQRFKESGETIVVPRRETQYLIYRTPQNMLKSGIVSVQLRYVSAEPKNDVENVDLFRGEVRFACKGFEDNVLEKEFPSNKEEKNDVRYEIYDRFHRIGVSFIDSEEEKILSGDFHVRYIDGVQRRCLSTQDAARRVQFLMHDRERYAVGLFGFLARLFGGPISSGSAIAESDRLEGNLTRWEMHRFSKLENRLLPYSKSNRNEVRPGCVSFTFNPADNGVEVGIVDLETKAHRPMRASDIARLPTWVFSTGDHR